MRSRPVLALLVVVFAAALGLSAQSPPAAESGAIVLRPARVFDGETMHEGWAVRASGERIEAAGPAANITTANARVVDLAGLTLTPGLVEGHSHILLHPYNEAPWEFQVAHEPLALRTARAVNHLRATLLAGFTTIRDLGTEGAATRTSG
jgi:imidazolonepropionase-like amidohydrolase